MKCKTCQVREFIHADLYCQGCPDKPKPKMKNGVSYLMSRYGERAIVSADVEAPAGQEYEYAAIERKSFDSQFQTLEDSPQNILGSYSAKNIERNP